MYDILSTSVISYITVLLSNVGKSKKKKTDPKLTKRDQPRAKEKT